MKSSARFTRNYFQKLPLRMLLLLGLFVGALLLFGAIIREVFWQQEVAADEAVFHWLRRHVISPQRTGFMKAVTYFASARFLQIAYGVLALLYLVRKDFKRVLEILAIGVGGYLLNFFMKLSFQRVRPSHPLIDPLHNFSFPSGHATSGFIFYGLLCYLVWKTKLPKPVKYISAAALLLFSLCIGFSRVYLRVHFASDVLAGFCVGFAWLLLSVGLLEQVKKKSDAELQQSVA